MVRDTAAYEASMAACGWDIEYAQWSPGQVECQAALAHLDGVTVRVETRASGNIVLNGVTGEDLWTMCIPLFPRAGTLIEGRRLGAMEAHLYPNGVPVQGRAKAPVRAVTIYVTRGWLARHLGDPVLGAIERFGRDRHRGVIRLGDSSDAVREASVRLVSGFDARGDDGPRPARDEFKRSICTCLIDALGRCPALAGRRSATYESAIEIRRRLDRSIRMPEPLGSLESQMGFSSRTIQRRFAEVYGLSPRDYILTRKLRLARHALLREGARVRGRMGVAEVAMSCGFGHMGRFSLRYRERFGESPSQTLAGARARVSQSG